MLKLVAVSLIGLAVVGWIIGGPGQAFDSGPPPPTIKAEPGPVKQRPEDYAGGRNRRHAAPVIVRRDVPDNTPIIDINLILAR